MRGGGPVRSYERAIRLRLRDSELDSLRPAEVRRSDVQAFADELLAIMSPGSASNILNPLQAYYRRAVHREELSANPTEGIDLPPKGSKRPRRIVSPEGAVALLAVLPPEERAIWVTAFYAGLRRGELQALRCMDVDLRADLIHVRSSAVLRPWHFDDLAWQSNLSKAMASGSSQAQLDSRQDLHRAGRCLIEPLVYRRKYHPYSAWPLSRLRRPVAKLVDAVASQATVPMARLGSNPSRLRGKPFLRRDAPLGHQGQ